MTSPVARTQERPRRPLQSSPRHSDHIPSRLRALDANDLKRRRARRHNRLIVFLGAAIVAGSLLVIAVSQALVASQQVRLDNLHQQLAGAVAKNENLQLNKAQLAAPARILKIAESKLGMIDPTNVRYLSPVDPGPAISDVASSSPK